MEVVCLILGPKLASQPCLLAFWVLTSLHLLSFLLKMFFIILVSIVFFLNGVNIFCRLQKYWCKLYYIMKSYNHIFIKICSSMKVGYFNYLCILFHLQMMSILCFPYSTVCSPTRSSMCHCVNHSVLQCFSYYTRRM